MEWAELLSLQPQNIKRVLKEEGVKGRYARITLSLAEAKTDEMLDIFGDYIGVVSITGDGTCVFKLDHRHSNELNLREVQEVSSPFGKLYFTTNGAGGTLTFYVGGALTARIKPVQGKTSIRNIAGSDVDLVEAKRFTSHAFKHLKPTTQTTTNVAQALIAASTKVKWAIIHFQAKVALIGDSTVTRGGGAADGQSYAEGAYLTVEYIDLTDIWIINSVLGESCIYSITYVEEA